ncbi:MAG: hypothetical protein K6G91_13305 [Kiritimatiellae bacterium]|nr:hypothetical protein [Kiritimatiellia bacterium]
MRSFFQSVLKHIDRLDAANLREQYRLLTDENDALGRILEMTDRGVVSLDARGNITYANPAAKTLLGDNLEGALGALGITPGSALKVETSVDYPESRTLEIRTLPSERITLVYIRDTTAEKKRTEEELRAGAAKAVCDLAAGVAHEIGNPLNAIAMNIQMLERDPTDRESLEICKNQVKRLDGIIRDFLAALRIRKPVLAPGSPADPLRSCLAALKQQFVERSIHVTVDIPATLPPVALDKDQIEQVFFNLVKNALEAMKDGSSLSIEIGADDRDVSVTFKDSGAGMTEDQLTHLFEPYRTSKEKGTGLGLMVSKRIVTDHGGTIAVTSKPGEGTTFVVMLPRIERRVRQLRCRDDEAP